MKAVVLNKAGGSDMLELTDVPKPELNDPEFIRVRLHAAGINPVDFKMRNAGTFFPDITYRQFWGVMAPEQWRRSAIK
jgi:NADPH:quinone reductase